jgi:hypothetical protein
MQDVARVRVTRRVKSRTWKENGDGRSGLAGGGRLSGGTGFSDAADQRRVDAGDAHAQSNVANAQLTNHVRSV